jgi:alpha/beta superfamily hydrolase
MQFQETTTLMIPGPLGNLEAIIEQPVAPAAKIVGIICHPHPLHGGTMQNKVVTTVVRAFQRLGVLAVRFNFRGVGQSAGEFAHAAGELDDLLAVITWIKQQYPDHAIWLAGFSFGSFVAAKAATLYPVSACITIAPPVHHFPFADLPPITCPWILIQGEADEVVPTEQVFQWAAKLALPPQVVRFPGIGHFFHGELITLRNKLVEELQSLSTSPHD